MQRSRFFFLKFDKIKNLFPTAPRRMQTSDIGLTINGILKSKSDKKDYKVIRLHNGLRILLISDLKDEEKKNARERQVSECTSEDTEYSEDMSEGSEDSEEYDDEEEMEVDQKSKNIKGQSRKQAAAALCVNVGSFSDPNSAPGLAHFLEHMVFMGSTKYPDENKFDAFIKRHGGSDNARTDTENTIFQFDIQPEYFAEALDIWAQFFISPLLKKDSIDREVKAVDSEFSLALNSDYCKKEQLLCSLIKEGHVMGKFTWGNKHSLTEIPKKHGVDVYQLLKDFHIKYYSAERMTLAVQSPESLESLEEMVTGVFSEVPNRNNIYNEILPPPEYAKQCEIGNFNSYSVVKLKPERDVHELFLTWILPPQQAFYKTKPLHYLSWLIGHEGKGSILSYLRKKQWAVALSSGNTESGLENNTTCSTFNISVTLTEEGFTEYENVLYVILHYLKLLQGIGPQQRIFNEIKKIEDIDFMFQEEKIPLEYVENQCLNLRLYPLQDILTGDELMTVYDPNVISNSTKELSIEKCIIFLSSPNHKALLEDDKIKTEPWFNTKYVIESLDADWIKKFENFTSNSAIKDLHIPNPNKLIAENFNIKEDLHVPEEGQKEYPQLITNDDDNFKLWFKQDNIFKLPKGYVNIHLGNNVANRTPHDRVCFGIFISILNLNMAEVVYDADAASLSYKINISTQGGLELQFEGYDDKLSHLIDIVIGFIAEFLTNEETFLLYLQRTKQNINNMLIKPSKTGNDLRLSILEKTHWSYFDKFKALSDITFIQFIEFTKEFRSNLTCEMLVQGNYSSLEAREIAKAVSKKLNSVCVNKNILQRERVLCLPAKQHCCKIKGVNNKDENSKITVYFQVGPTDIKQAAIMELLVTIMDEPCFDILRTKEQFGYVVYAQEHNTAGILGFSVNIQSQSTKHSVEKVDNAILRFVKDDMKKIIDNLSTEEFSTQVASIIAIKQNDDSHLGEEVERNWSEIKSQNYNFHRLEREVVHLKACTLEQLKQFYKETCLDNLKILHVQVKGNPDKSEVKENNMDIEYLSYDENEDNNLDKSIALEYINDITKFKEFSSFYPVSHVKSN